MDLKNEMKNVLKAGCELTVAGAKKAGELVSAFINYLNEKTKAQMQQQQQVQTQQQAYQAGNYIYSELIRVFMNQTVPVGLATVRSSGVIQPLAVNHVHGRVYAFHFSWTKSTTQIFCQAQINSIMKKLNQMLILAGCNFTINSMIDQMACFELIIHYTI